MLHLGTHMKKGILRLAPISAVLAALLFIPGVASATSWNWSSYAGQVGPSHQTYVKPTGSNQAFQYSQGIALIGSNFSNAAYIVAGPATCTGLGGGMINQSGGWTTPTITPAAGPLTVSAVWTGTGYTYGNVNPCSLNNGLVAVGVNASVVLELVMLPNTVVAHSSLQVFQYGNGALYTPGGSSWVSTAISVSNTVSFTYTVLPGGNSYYIETFAYTQTIAYVQGTGDYILTACLDMGEISVNSCGGTSANPDAGWNATSISAT